MRNKTYIHPHAMKRMALLTVTLLFPLWATAAATGDHIDYTFKGRLHQDTHCSFTGSGTQLVDFGSVGFQDVGGGKKSLLNKPALPLTVGLSCTGSTTPIYLQFESTAATDTEVTSTTQILKIGNGAGIELFVDGTPTNFKSKITVANPGSSVPAFTAKVVQIEKDGHSLTDADFSVTATLRLTYS